ncbi:MAG: phytanoyl-CoA dioxygenase family protein [Gammaproteobacteria bacterium]
MKRINQWDFWKIFTANKKFDSFWLGCIHLNRAGLHPIRIKLADLSTIIRKLFLSKKNIKESITSLEKDGILVINNFLPKDNFASLQSEIRERTKNIAAKIPEQTGDKPGFHAPSEFPGGFDRLDGATLNRFINIDSENTPILYDFIHSPRFANLCSYSSSLQHTPRKFKIYKMIHGDSDKTHDLQQDLHTDTFHSVIKLWFFLEDVKNEDGFMYSVGSHKMTFKRLLWEYKRSILACLPRSPHKGGSFRLDKNDLEKMNFPQATAFAPKANTLLIADTRGFHCRGKAKKGAVRLAIYAGLRPSPFVPFPY